MTSPRARARRRALINAAVHGEPVRLTMRTYLILRTNLEGTPLSLAVETVNARANEHPEWDLLTRKTWLEWEAELG